ncbi:hypothetical protein Aca07nite_37240 [Actinoplanes capillaceus]|uniref:HEAT repeat-containing protein n=1 Tax=Actinoplanes campanulatus TaxID=113559 RepID=A0ABQ3WJM1_9ACTN|nr:hypothetical protein [Actinoplanes capillaceus]GID46449.1 hypothetical protein Aca07nite_37240 [Actinoplanes capillaceus]
MSVDATVERLASSDRTEREAAEETLVAAGAEAVEPVLRALCDEESPIDWSTSASLLRRLGDPAFGPLIAAMAAAPTSEVARRCGWALMAVEVSTPAVYLPALRHPHPKVRRSGIYFFQRRQVDAEPYLPDLIALLDDPDEGVRDNLIRGFGEIGAVAAPALREVRRGAGRKRRAALAALAEIGGWDALDDHDRRVITRLIEIKSGYEEPEPMHLCGSWYALPTADQAAVLDAFDLVEPRPVTMRLGESAWNRDQHSSRHRVEHPECRRNYVTPCLDGWTLVFGRMPSVAHIRDADDFEKALRADVKARTARLSDRFGAAHWYGTSCGDGWTAWCIAEKGEVVRFYDNFDPDDQIGDGHPAETGYRLPHGSAFPEGALAGLAHLPMEEIMERIRQLREELDIPDDADSTMIAGRLSVNPDEFGPHTRVEGRAVLALTACGVAHGSTPGALSV